MPFNDAQARSIATTLAHVGALLDEVDASTGARRSSFAAEQQDLSDEECRALIAFAADAHAAILRAFERLGVAPPAQHASARWRMRTALLSSDVVLSELTGKSLGRYGEIDSASSKEVDTVVLELRELIGRGMLALESPGRGA